MSFVIMSSDPRSIIQARMLWRDPITIYTAQIESRRSALNTLSSLLPEREIIFFVRIAWSVENVGHYEATVALFRKHQIEFPRHHVFFVCNTTEEFRILQSDGIPCILANANCFVDPSYFTIMPRTEKRYSAVYNAQLSQWKRHDLASQVPKVAFMYHSYNESMADYKDYLTRVVPGAVFLNHMVATPARDLTPKEMSFFLNSSSCGLCLSSEEGVMSAAIEYLLTGIPIVTTSSLGGRNEYFDELNSIFVDDNASSIAQAVNVWCTTAVDPTLIRQRTIKKQQAIVESFITQVERIVQDFGGIADLRGKWDQIFINKMQAWERVSEFIERNNL